MPMQIVLGLRWEDHGRRIHDVAAVPLSKRWTSDNDLLDVFGAGQQEVTQTFRL